MNRFLLAVSLALFSAFASASVLTFDELDGTKKDIPDNYGGFNWDGVIYTVDEDWYSQDSGSKTGVISHRNVVAGFSSTVSSANGAAFTFNGAYFTKFWTQVEMDLSFQGYKDGSLLFTSETYHFTDMLPQWIELNWAGIDAIYIDASSKLVFDNFTVNEIATSVPEASTLALFGLGLFGLGVTRRRQR